MVIYIAFTEHPLPQMIAQLEQRIGNFSHSTDPLLLAYGALVGRASPDLQHRMTLFLLSRLPLAETNTSTLVHHILSLRNTESKQITGSLVDYLTHPDQHVQLCSIHALRYATGDSLVQKALRTLVSQLNATDDHLATILHTLLFGLEHATNTHTDKYNIRSQCHQVSVRDLMWWKHVESEAVQSPHTHDPLSLAPLHRLCCAVSPPSCHLLLQLT